jgi:hypothetical protein
MAALQHWDSFYVIVGSAAGALIGLQFVVVTLIAENPPPNAAEAGAAFATPTIVHFSVAFFLSALARAPWQAVTTIATIWGIIGVTGIVYNIAVARRMRLQSTYKPEVEDWLYYAAVPLVAYVILACAALIAPSSEREALFGVGAAALMLMFIGIRNAWDAVAFHVLVFRHGKDAGAEVK